MYDELLNFLIACGTEELKTICDEMKRNSFNGFDEKQDLIDHIVNHHTMYDMLSKDVKVPANLQENCSKRKCEIEEIICKHKQMMYLLDRNKMQLNLITESRLDEMEWINKYGKDFCDLVDKRKYRCLKTIKYYLYKGDA